MGLPSQYHHPEHGLCVVLQRAALHLQTRSIAYRIEQDVIIIMLPDSQERRVEPLALAVGKMYALRDLDRDKP